MQLFYTGQNFLAYGFGEKIKKSKSSKRKFNFNLKFFKK